MPVAAVVEDKIMGMHGGLSPDLLDLGQIANISRPTDVPDEGLLCDLLWADPDASQFGWGANARGVSYTFGYDVIEEFLEKHDMDLICRAHQVVEDGYEFQADRLLRSEEHTSELQSLMRISYAVFCLKNKTYCMKHTQYITMSLSDI